ncbi:Cmx/CmrA family chloramphenicol efflux MFS transporter [Embleya hyalina]|uniref:Putative chloramphenicol resistance protein n=1 Tax=Embleya hyalina TaxID=516124 RepID=A0A401YIU4_9ACTN|nr:Cmx/CmrA family chloramphenicol efflux MFS transporter [Embleya hyalina]GCD94521.1 putative chloramphenicol resistance protein [Embleya hyalina]
MPFAVYVLGLAVFAQGTSEFMLSGLLSGIADDLHVSIPTAGLLTSAFAIGMVVGAPAMALIGRRQPRRRALLFFLCVFIAAHVVGALTPNYAVLLATRVLGALANAGFWAVALVTAIDLVRPEQRARATSVVVGGVTIACVVGVPAGALLGDRWGWRAAFWAVALVSLPAVLAIARTIPNHAPPAQSGPPVHARRELRALFTRPLLLTLSVMALVQGATFCAFSYFEPVITEVTGLGDGWVPIALALFGVGSFVGVTVAGRIIDRRPTRVIGWGMVASAVGWAVFAYTAATPWAAITLIAIQGMLAFATGTALIARVLRLSQDTSGLAGALATSAFNIGGTLGPWLGGLTIDADLGYRAPLATSAALTLLALTVAATTHRPHHRDPKPQLPTPTQHI